MQFVWTSPTDGIYVCESGAQPAQVQIQESGSYVAMIYRNNGECDKLPSFSSLEGAKQAVETRLERDTPR
jgi:hypothetical protein